MELEKEKQIILDFLKLKEKSRLILDGLKRKSTRGTKDLIPSNNLLLKAYHELLCSGRIKKSQEIEGILRVKEIRSLSGIVVVSVLTKPYPCPGKCIFCPTQKNVPKSYIKEEPAVSRAISLNYHPYKQVQSRIDVLEQNGHPTDKIELRIIGATWSYYPKNYQSWFIKQCFKAANDYGGRKSKVKTLEKLQKENEKAKHRIIGIMIETRPDYIDSEEIKRLRNYGITMVELGIQSIYDNVLSKNKRGHKVRDAIKATKLLKDAGFKICYQMMPNLLGSSPKKDIEMFKEIFSNADFQPDYLKIYPCALLKEAYLFRYYQRKEYEPYTLKQLLNVLKEIKKNIPYYCRIQRIIRDIPSSYILKGGAKISSIRQNLLKIQQQEGWRCRCIRCREIRSQSIREKPRLFKETYPASDGKEIFLSFENKDRTKLFSLLRLRISSNNKAIIREVHTYGQLTAIGDKGISAQHKGLGRKLISFAEEIAKKDFNLKNISVISGVGVRDYYRRQGYSLKNTYMVKRL
ncbi:MAG: tRNA uridine(34) 5-carboxymethylaminomethyl modification radical SAM/GNAT enzyme Elp3 [Candidatus Paceibacterota bacterium]|jgi:elongator complex protein 3